MSEERSKFGTTKMRQSSISAFFFYAIAPAFKPIFRGLSLFIEMRH